MTKQNHTIATLRAAVDALEHTPDAGTPHMNLPDLYDLGNLATQLTRTLRQVTRHALDDLSHLHGADLRDADGADPYARLTEAQQEMEELSRHLQHGLMAAEDYHSAIGRLAHRDAT